MRAWLENFFFVIDLEEVDYIAVDSKIKKNTYLSLTFAFLLFGSTIVTTLGLLLENSPAVIGGMLLSPLMWPLIKIATGISNDRYSYVSKGFWLLIISILVSVLSAALITYISPIKSLNDEILSRTNPTFVDLVIALVSGAVAALAITQPKMSESLAGVAIATALMPPLCVVGIGVAFLEPVIALESFGLFMANMFSIIFVAILVFFMVGFKRVSEKTVIRRRGFVFVTVVLSLMTIPLFWSLIDYAVEFDTPRRIEMVLQTRIDQISPSINLEEYSFRTEERNGQDFVIVNANLQVPQGVIIDYLEQQKITQELEDTLNRKVDLQLVILQTVSVISAQDIEVSQVENQLLTKLVEELQAKKPSFEIDNIQATLSGEWRVEAVLSGSPDLIFAEEEREKLEQILTNEIEQPVTLDIRILPTTKLQSNPELEADRRSQEIKRVVRQSFTQLSELIEVTSIEFSEKVENVTNLNIDLRKPSDLELTVNDIESVRFNLETVFSGEKFDLRVEVVNREFLDSNYLEQNSVTSESENP